MLINHYCHFLNTNTHTCTHTHTSTSDPPPPSPSTLSHSPHPPVSHTPADPPTVIPLSTAVCGFKPNSSIDDDADGVLDDSCAFLCKTHASPNWFVVRYVVAQLFNSILIRFDLFTSFLFPYFDVDFATFRFGFGFDFVLVICVGVDARC